MEPTPNSPPPFIIHWRRSWLALICLLVIPWLLLATPSGQLQHGDIFMFAMLWQLVHVIWIACLLALLVRRNEKHTQLIFAAGIVFANLVLTIVLGEMRPEEMVSIFMVTVVAQVISFFITLALRFSYTVAYRTEISTAAANEVSQYSLHALFLATFVLAVIVAVLSAAIRSRFIGHVTDLIPWLTLISVALLWNELFQWRLRLLNVVVCSMVWVGLLGWRSEVRSADWQLFAMFTLVIYIFPVAYRWAGWRMVRRELLQQAVEKMSD